MRIIFVEKTIALWRGRDLELHIEKCVLGGGGRGGEGTLWCEYIIQSFVHISRQKRECSWLLPQSYSLAANNFLYILT